MKLTGAGRAGRGEIYDGVSEEVRDGLKATKRPLIKMLSNSKQ